MCAVCGCGQWDLKSYIHDVVGHVSILQTAAAKPAEVKRCDQCKHWNLKPGRWMGDCTHADVLQPMTEPDGGSGCRCFERRT